MILHWSGTSTPTSYLYFSRRLWQLPNRSLPRLPPPPKERIYFNNVSVSLSFADFITHLLSFFLASLADFITTSDAKLITRARDIISNPIMVDFTTDDAQDPAHYQMAVCGEIATLFHHLWVSLLLLDTLMESYVGSTREFLSFCSILTVVISCFEYY